MFQDKLVGAFASLALFLFVFALFAWLALNALAPTYTVDGFFSNPSFFVFLFGTQYFFVLATICTLLVAAGIVAFLWYVRRRQLFHYLIEPTILLEVRLPQQANYSLALMESFLEAIYSEGGEGNWYTRWFQGKTRIHHSFEIVSQGGIVSFYMRIRASARETVSTAVYAHFPRAQVAEVDDYAHQVPYDPETWELWGCEWKLKNGYAAPLKTYIEFGLRTEEQREKDLKTPGAQGQIQKYLHDPMTLLFDAAGSLSGREQFWVQFVFRAQKYPHHDPEKEEVDVFDRDLWEKKKLSEEIIQALQALKEEQDTVRTAGQQRIELGGARMAEKSAYEVGIRMLYLAPSEEFNKGRKALFLNVFRSVSTSDNSLAPGGRLLDDRSVFGDDSNDPERIKEKDELLQFYRDRLFWFWPAHKRKTTVLSTEALATICHFPTSLIETPSVRRTLAATAEPPTILPT